MNSGPAWEVRSDWHEASERAFANFIQERWSTSFLNSPDSPYQGLRIESSDQAIIARAIFAQENGLPFRVRLTSGQIVDQSHITNGADPRLRLRNFLNFVADGFNSEAIAHNSFPVKVSVEALEPGVIFVTDSQDARGESIPAIFLLHQLGPHGHLRFSSIRTSSATEQRRIFQRWHFPTTIPLNVLPNNRMGFRRFFQPQDYSLTPRARSQSQALRGRSDTDQVNLTLLAFARAREAYPDQARLLTQAWTNRGLTNQFQFVTAFWRTVQAKLSDNTEESDQQLTARILEIACDYLQERALTIEDIIQALRRQIITHEPSTQGLTIARCNPTTDIYQSSINERERELNHALEPLKNWIQGRLDFTPVILNYLETCQRSNTPHSYLAPTALLYLNGAQARPQPRTHWFISCGTSANRRP